MNDNTTSTNRGNHSPGRTSQAQPPLSRAEQARVLSSFRVSVKLMLMAAINVALLGTMVYVSVDRIFDSLTPSIRRDLEWKALHGVVELRGTADLGIVAHDPESVARAAAALVGDVDVVAIHVMGEHESVFDHGHVPFDWKSYANTHGKVVQQGELLIAALPVEIEGLAVGSIALAVSTRRLQAGMHLRQEILVAGAWGAALALLLSLAFVQLYIAPLMRVTADAFHKLEKTTLAALESARIKSEFLANMSHEIRTPMNGIMGVTKLAINLPMEAKLRRYIEVIDTSARGLLTIINDILDFSKIEAGKYEIRPHEFEPRNLVEDSIDMLAERAREKALELVYRISPEVPDLLIGDSDRVKQILVNLIGNAVKFTDVGEVFVELTMNGPDDKRRLRIDVRDTGCGIAKADQETLFHAFTQVDGSSVRRYGGTGLGLAIAKRLTELMDGEIGLESEVGRGSNFWFTVAVGVGAARERSKRSPLALRALVVEPNARLRTMAVEHMRRWGLTCDAVESVEQALTVLAQPSAAGDAVRVAVVSVLTSSAQVQALKQLRAQATPQALPLVFLGSPSSGDYIAELGEPLCAQVAKPIRASELYDRLCSVLAHPSDFVTWGSSTSPRERRRLRSDWPVLVVDDNEINRFVAVEHLRELGFRAETAEDGAQAVAAVFANRYSAVLMDCQMPVMDGYTAAREIRRREAGERHVPIIALTAHALLGERDNVLAAGMDDYIAKPIKPSTLERALLHWTTRDASNPPLQPEVFKRDEDSQSLRPVIAADQIPELDASADPSARLIEMFRRVAPAQLAELASQIQQRDVEAARAQAHKLKGGLYAIGALRLPNDLEALRALIAEPDWHAADARLVELTARVNAVCDALGQPLMAADQGVNHDSRRPS